MSDGRTRIHFDDGDVRQYMDGVLVKKQKRAGIDGWSERYFRFSQNDRKLQYWKDEQDFKNNKAPRGAIIVQKLYQLPERDSGKKAHRLDVQGKSIKHQGWVHYLDLS